MQASVFCTKRIEGLTIPVFKVNGGNYLIDLAIYEDGTISAWNYHDLKQFQAEDLAFNQVLPKLENGASFSISGLGSFQIDEASFINNSQDELFTFVFSKVKALNPELSNIYEESERVRKLWQDRHVCFCKTPKPFLVKSEIFYNTLDGEGLRVFINYQDQTYLAFLVCYADGFFRIERISALTENIAKKQGQAQIDKESSAKALNSKSVAQDNLSILEHAWQQYSDTPCQDLSAELLKGKLKLNKAQLSSLIEQEKLSLEEVVALVQHKIIVSALPQNKSVTVVIEDLGLLHLTSFTKRAMPKKDFCRKFADLKARVTKQKDSLDFCRECHYQYLLNPCLDTQNRLREAYYNVPKDERIFLGDMDTRDTLVLASLRKVHKN